MKNEISIKNLTVSITDSRVDFDVYDSWDDSTTHYHTNREGEGLWIGWDYMKQIIGTCDFALRQSTRSGMYKAIRKYFE